MGRNENDFYATPDALALSCCEAAKLLIPDFTEIIEPSAGSGAFVRASKSIWSGVPVTAIEIRQEEYPNLIASGADEIFFDDWPVWVQKTQPGGRPLVIGNPPFSFAAEHIQAALDWLLPGSHVAFLLKMNFLGGKGRAEMFWPQKQLKYLQPIAGRPSFKKTEAASNDTNEYGWYIWQVGFAGEAELRFPHIVWN